MSRHPMLTQDPNAPTVWLQGVGNALAKPAGDLKAGDLVGFNYGQVYRVEEIARETPKSIWVVFSRKGTTYPARRYAKTTLVASAPEG